MRGGSLVCHAGVKVGSKITFTEYNMLDTCLDEDVLREEGLVLGLEFRYSTQLVHQLLVLHPGKSVGAVDFVRHLNALATCAIDVIAVIHSIHHKLVYFRHHASNPGILEQVLVVELGLLNSHLADDARR